ncbi:GUN4 domain-containing protein [Anabaena cylindrica UHCC 0172]|uniref:GUN4 domain-containing protein n=1 Tax=Anabaena cylindrica TaxID=1165 RepID=UPI002B2140F8|nr:GUN4 domain-containing protein [Anabaena cylindrica]MEA5549955.1 GUN4 domain-containing protein [Anabaena cylindrica UHCC 0172]
MNNPQEPEKYDQANLKSAVEQDYTRLRDLLAAGKWEEADEETAQVILAVAKRKKQGWLDVESIDNFPCEDLRTIDQLWVKYSDERYGFSVQKRIYQGLGGTKNYDEKIWRAFGNNVGWMEGGDWWSYKDITFDNKAREGHFPLMAWMVWAGEWLGWVWCFRLGGLGWVGFLSRQDL